MAAWHLFVATLLQVPTPTTVNDGVLGRPEDFSLAGPGRVCLNITAFELRQGETAHVDYLGIHAGRLRIIGPQGQIDLAENETMAPIRAGSRKVAETADRTTYRLGRGEGRRYVISAVTAWSGRRQEPILTVTGSALRGTEADFAILGRVSLLREDYSGCARRFEYGWNFLLGPPDEDARR